jgi:DNA-binding response OmpR family regulator
MVKKRIMIADDDPAIVDAISMMLEFEGYETIPTVDGAVVKELQDTLPDLILLDIWMSGEDGKDICKKLKKQETTKHIPIIMISASRDVEKSAKESGADDFIAKPFEMEELLTKVKIFTSAN